MSQEKATPNPERDISLIDFLIDHPSESSSDEELVIDILLPESFRKNSSNSVDVPSPICDTSDSPLTPSPPEKCKITSDFFKCRQYMCTGHLWSEPDLPRNIRSPEQNMKIGVYDEKKKCCRLMYPNFKCRRSWCSGHSWNMPEGETSPSKKTTGTQTEENDWRNYKVNLPIKHKWKNIRKKRSNLRERNSPRYYFVKNYFA